MNFRLNYKGRIKEIWLAIIFERDWDIRSLEGMCVKARGGEVRGREGGV